ncbi:MAG TPA: cell division protein ZapA [Rhizomicrobium sp.]
MPLVNVTVNERSYAIACGDGEEGHLRSLAAHVDAKMRGLLPSAGQAAEPRLLLMAALVIADEYFESLAQLEKSGQELQILSGARDAETARIADTEQKAAVALEGAAARIEEVAARLSGA